MPVKRATKGKTESDLEAEIHGALRLAFPWLPEGSIQHQTTFSFSLGKQRITIDGTKGDSARARSDVFLYLDKQPLAVLELKRGGLPLKPDDDTQGLSYARVIYPSPPLVVVTNGKDVRLLETHTGNEWSPDEPSEEALADLIRAASQVAAHDLKAAINTLMGSNPAVWMQAIRQTSVDNIADLTDDWSEPLLPFVPDFLIPRKATQTALKSLRTGQKLILIDGPPLIGKSNILRELSQETNTADDLAIFFIEAGEGVGVFQNLADIISQALNWPLTRDEVRTWLLHLSKTSGPNLVLAIDGLGLNQGAFKRDVEDICSRAFGPAVQLILSLDETVADRLVINSTGRKKSVIGRMALRVPVGPLDDQEFTSACQALWDHRVSFMKGGESSAEFRVPWILRAVVSHVVCQPQYTNKNVHAVIPSLLGLDLIDSTRQTFDDDELRRLFQALAGAVIEDAQDQKRPISLILESISIFVVQRSTLKKYLEHAEIKDLIESGYLRSILHESGRPILVIRLPELLASEAANLLATEILEHTNKDAEEAADWLSGAAMNLPLGGIIASQAIIDAAKLHGDLSFNLIRALIKAPPRQEAIPPGTKVSMHWPDVGIMDMTFLKNGAIEVNTGGQSHLIRQEPGEEVHTVHGNFHSWLILSHLVSRPFELDVKGRSEPARIDPAILLEVGTCTIPLHRPGGDPNIRSLLTHEIPEEGSIVCHKEGIVEQITLSILRFLSSEGENAEEWIEEAVGRESLPLISRIDIALRQLSGSAITEKAEFASRMLEDVVRPAISSSPLAH
jgi:hypothetical protein